MRLAAVDVGSNTVHVLVADAGPDGALRDVAHYVEMPELGPRVQRDGRLGAEGVGAGLRALDAVMSGAAGHGWDRLVAGATAAVRGAADGTALLDAATARLGVPMRLISEEREARLSFLGVAIRHAAAGDWLMADLGGGSTEVVAGRAEAMGEWASLRLGSGALAHRHLSDPPAAGERVAARAEAAAALRDAPAARPERLVVTGGTAATLPTLLREPERLRLTADDLARARDVLDAAPAARVAAERGVRESRVRALRGGVEILLELLGRYALTEFDISFEGLRHGMLVAYLRCGDDWWREDAG